MARLVLLFFGSTAQAYEAPWCAVIERGTGSVYWDCQYHSFDDCYAEAIFWQAIAAFIIRARTTSEKPQNTGA
jgi:hypothetical protein